MDDSCGYEGYEFGGSYIDSICIDGYLWDLDSCDEPGGGLTKGGDLPCPRCNTGEFLRQALDAAQEDVAGVVQRTPYCAAVVWENSLRKANKEAADFTMTWVSALSPFVIQDWPDRRAVYEGRSRWENTVDRQWPWPLDLDGTSG